MCIELTPQLTNPFVDVRADNPTMAAFAGKPLKVRGLVLQTSWSVGSEPESEP